MNIIDLKKELLVSVNKFKYKDQIILETSFLDEKIDSKHLSLRLRIFCILNDILSVEQFPKCIICGQICKFNTSKNNFAKSCSSKKCCYAVRDMIVTPEMYAKRNQNREKTNLKRYNCKNISSVESVKIKKEETNLKNCGFTNTFKSEITKKKIIKTNIKKFGCKNPSSCESIKLKKIETCLKNSGFTHPMKIKSIANIVSIKIKKYIENNVIYRTTCGHIYNKQACSIIDEYGKKHNYNFIHAENGGEFSIKIGKIIYTLDGYDENKNVAIEIDDDSHFSNDVLLKKDIIRENAIKKILGCKFIRIRVKGDTYNVYQE
jgi:hypothetical protein